MLAATCVTVGLLLSHPERHWGTQTGIRPADQLAMELQTALKGKRSKTANFYQARNFAPIWFDGDNITADARQTIAILAEAGEDGLPPDRYKIPPIPAAKASDTVKAEFDQQMTGAVLQYAHDMRWGAISPATLFDDVSLPRETDDVSERLLLAARGGNVHTALRALEPQIREYGLLKVALKTYRAASRAVWPTVMAGTSPNDLRQLEMRLQAEGYLVSGGARGSPAAIQAALRAYQADNGLTADGKLTDRTVAMLNIPPDTRADQIAVNMERWRWLPRDMGQRYIMVNVPDASLVLVEAGTPALVSRVVVGAPDKPTPILEANAVAVTINPSWHVPKSIVEKEIQPKLEADPNYLADKNMVSQDGDVIQQPGPDNALGTAKFEMPNPFDVYLHDTPSKHAFLSDDRALSHGCVRVEAIHSLVDKVLAMDDQKLQDLIAARQTIREPIPQGVPVYIQYWTAIARGDHRIVFREDIYGRDARMISALFPQHDTIKLAGEH
jgi:murein L,D-transpeptidase YcbB/YkuD